MKIDASADCHVSPRLHGKILFDARALIKIAWTQVHVIDVLVVISDSSDSATRPAKVSFHGDIVSHGTNDRELRLYNVEGR